MWVKGLSSLSSGSKAYHLCLVGRRPIVCLEGQRLILSVSWVKRLSFLSRGSETYRLSRGWEIHRSSPGSHVKRSNSKHIEIVTETFEYKMEITNARVLFCFAARGGIAEFLLPFHSAIHTNATQTSVFSTVPIFAVTAAAAVIPLTLTSRSILPVERK